ncbi:zinc finger protein 436-like [Leguminivora glycinivorella]|uniref:zinc finger protein 436-like n=1 Tax=Leguminivora glycinivorella TaxID=1035111 RepID=UPI0020108B2B|nr:zinc finger protein 436-like [Leguminivora glycinivorella]
MKNKQKKKQLKKEQKKLKKLKKEVKTEEIEIKPEDGYIGNEKATDFVENTVAPDNVTQSKNDNINVNVNNEIVSKVDNVNNVKSAETEKEVEYNKDLEKIYKCSACNKQFSLSYYLKLHVRSHTDEKPYTCAECGQSFITASKLGRHNKRIHLAIKYQCRICYKIFTRFEYLTRHFDKKHAEDKLEGEPYDYNAILPYLKELEEQLREKAEAENKPKTEELWSDWPEMDQTLMQDRNDTDEKKDFAMNHLDIVMDEVKVPVETMETGTEIEIKLEKEQDNDMGVDNDDLPDNDHHDGVKDESFSDEDYFPSNTWAEPPRMEGAPPSPPARGRRAQGAGPLTCSICDKKISTHSYMRIHLRTHTGEKPYKCYICSRGFITSSKMHRHVLTHSESFDKDGVKIEADVKQEGEEAIKEEEGDTGTK